MTSKEIVKKDNDVIPINSIFDIDPITFKEGLKLREENRQTLLRWISANLKEDIDYGTIKNKKSLWKPGAEKIRGMLGVKATYPDAEKYIESASQGKIIEQVFIKCVIITSDSIVLSEGLGARTLRQDKGDINKCVKMAEKSACIDATLNLCGLSEIFTQDLEDMFKEDINNTPSDATAKVAKVAKTDDKEELRNKLNDYMNNIKDPVLQKTVIDMMMEIHDINDLKDKWMVFKEMRDLNELNEEQFQIVVDIKDMMKKIIN